MYKNIHIGIAPRFSLNPCLSKYVPENSLNTIFITEPAIWDTDICFFKFPEHLCRKWWDMAHNMELNDEYASNSLFTIFCKSLCDFAKFKKIPGLENSHPITLIRPPNTNNLFEKQGIPNNIMAVINLGDEETFLKIQGLEIILIPGEGVRASKQSYISIQKISKKTDIDVLLIFKE